MENPASSIQHPVSSIQYCLVSFLLLCLCASSWPAEGKISGLQKQISVLEKQKAQLEAEKRTLVVQGDELSHKIEALKIQARSGLGIIGRYKLSRNLRKAQALSEKLQSLEKRTHKTETELKDKKSELEREYEHQIAVLLDKLSGTSQTEERREILEKVKEYQSAKEQLTKPAEEEEPEHLDITKIEIEEYDGPQEIREKADLISDFANKLNSTIDMLDTRIEKLQEELKTRRKLGEFAEEISFFGERISKEEVAADSGKEPVEGSVEKPDEEPVTLESGKSARDANTVTPPTTETPVTTATQPPAATSSTMVMERNGVSADFVGTSLNQIEKEIELLEKRRQDLKKELSTLSEKANSFHRKADEIEKSEIKTGGKKG
jgi:chromosome segregation ATPase